MWDNYIKMYPSMFLKCYPGAYLHDLSLTKHAAPSFHKINPCHLITDLHFTSGVFCRKAV